MGWADEVELEIGPGNKQGGHSSQQSTGTALFLPGSTASPPPRPDEHRPECARGDNLAQETASQKSKTRRASEPGAPIGSGHQMTLLDWAQKKSDNTPNISQHNE